MIKKVLVAVDGSTHATKAVEYASDIAVKYGAEMHLIYVISKQDIPEGYMEYAKVEKIEEAPDAIAFTQIGAQILSDAENLAKRSGVNTIYKIIKQGDPAHEITNYAKDQRVDSIFVGSRGLSKFKGVVLGSVSNKVCHLAEATCITVK